MIKAILFDFDGLLVDSQPLQFQSVKRIFNESGKDLTAEEFKENWIKTNKNASTIINDYQLSISPEEYTHKKSQYLKEEVDKGLNLKKGALNILNLAKNNFKTAIVTNNLMENQIHMLKKLDIHDYFNELITRDLYQQRKPSPESYLLASKKLNINPKNCLVLEDSDIGLQSAKSAGMSCIVVPDEFTKGSNFEDADLILNSLSEINLEIINKF